MAVTVTVIAGGQIAEGEQVTRPKFNQMANPTVSVTGTISNTEIANGAVHDVSATPGAYWFGVTAGTGSAYTLTLSPALAALTQGAEIFFKAHADCAAAATINVNGLGAKALAYPVGSPVGAEDIKADQMVGCRYSTSGAGRWEVFTTLAYPSTLVFSGAPNVAGSANAITISTGTLYPQFGGATGLARRTVIFNALSTNTTSVTLTVDGISQVLYKKGTVLLSAGDITAGQLVQAYNNGSYWKIIDNSPAKDDFYLGTVPVVGSVFTVTNIPGFPTAYYDGLRVRFISGGTGSAALSVNTLAGDSIRKTGVAAGFIADTDIQANQIVDLIYGNSTWWVSNVNPWNSQFGTVNAAIVTISPYATIVEPHGLSTCPRSVRAVLECTTTEHGYAVGAMIPIESVVNNGAAAGSGATSAFQAYADNTNVYVTQLCTGAFIRITDLSVTPSSALVALTSIGNWRLRVYWAL